jgi:hypothetical protein
MDPRPRGGVSRLFRLQPGRKFPHNVFVRKVELMILAVLAALAAVTPDAAPAPVAQAPAQAAAPATAKAKEDLVCKTEQVTGSRFPKKVCYSKAEYEAKRQLDQQHLRESQAGGLQRQ